jgi:hypothetical protein
MSTFVWLAVLAGATFALHPGRCSATDATAAYSCITTVRGRTTPREGSADCCESDDDSCLFQDSDVIAEPDDTDYGMREFIIRDPNGFWITFGTETLID